MNKNEYCEMVMQSMGPAEALMGMVPQDKLDWRPDPSFMSIGQVLAHLGEGIGSSLEITLSGKWPSMEEMAAGMKLENMPSCGVQEALGRLEKDKKTLRATLDSISEEDFSNRVVSVPWGWSAKVELMGVNFLGHFNNHKMQLFTYLKLLGLPVDTQTLYGG